MLAGLVASLYAAVLPYLPSQIQPYRLTEQKPTIERKVSQSGEQIDLTPLASLSPDKRCKRLLQILAKTSIHQLEAGLIQYIFPMTLEEAKQAFPSSEGLGFKGTVDDEDLSYSFYGYKKSNKKADDWNIAIISSGGIAAKIYYFPGELVEVFNKNFSMEIPYGLVFNLDPKTTPEHTLDLYTLRFFIEEGRFTCSDLDRTFLNRLFKQIPKSHKR